MRLVQNAANRGPKAVRYQRSSAMSICILAYRGGHSLPRRFLSMQVPAVDLRSPASWPAFDDMGVVEQPVDHGGHGSIVAEQLAPVFDRPIRGQDRRRFLVTAHDDFE